MERIYLPPKVGKTLGVIIFGFASFSTYQAVDTYGQTRYHDGQADALHAADQVEAAAVAGKKVDELQARLLGNILVSLGFIGVSSTSFYLASNGRG